MGLTILYAGLFQNQKVGVFYVIPVNAVTFSGILILFNLFLITQNTKIDAASHLGGAAGGALSLLLLRRLKL